jgi:hypothetical protein
VSSFLFYCVPEKNLGDFLFTKYSGDQIKNNEMGEACGTCGRNRGSYRVLVGRLDVRRLLGGPRHRWKDNIKMDS